MRQLLPEAQPHVEPYDAYRSDDPLAPQLRLNFVASADGAATDERGVAGGLGGRGDREVFRALRALADAILVGAGTVRAEGYGPHRLPPALAARRRADGRFAPAPVVVVSRSLALEPSWPLFTEAVTPTVVLTCEDAPAARLGALEPVAVVLVAGRASVDLGDGLRRLRRELGLVRLLCEGGPTLATGLLAAGLVDELCLTVAPALLGGAGPRIVRGLRRRVPLELVAAFCEDDELYLRYRIAGK